MENTRRFERAVESAESCVARGNYRGALDEVFRALRLLEPAREEKWRADGQDVDLQISPGALNDVPLRTSTRR